MSLKFSDKKPFRFFKQYLSIQIEEKRLNYWYSEVDKKWIIPNEYDWKIKTLRNSVDCRSIRAFRSHLRKHKELPKGTKLILIGKYVGQNATGKI